MVSIARKNLFEDIPRFLVAQAGIMFAVSLVTIQLGILKGFTRSTTRLIESSTADIWLTGEEMVHFELTQSVPLETQVKAKEIGGVARAEAMVLTNGRWRGPDGQISTVRVVGFSPSGSLFRPSQILQGDIAKIAEPFSIMTDGTNLKSLDLSGIDDEGEINSAPAALVGLTRDTQSIASSSIVFTSLENAKAYATAGLTSSVSCDVRPGGDNLQCTTTYTRAEDDAVVERQPLSISDPVSYVLIQAEPTQDIAQLKQRLEEAFPEVQALTQEEMLNITRRYWQLRTGIGFILGLGAAVGMIVGIVIVGQILYSSVSDHIREYGTLKAMGASDRMIYGVIVEQALWMAVLGYIPSILLCLGLGAWTFSTQGIMILITPSVSAGILGITVIMCVGSALFAIQKVTKVDPAIVFKA
ncbi:MAG: FtsX-like permease family protein [Elainellaceae cyanobacterium]